MVDGEKYWFEDDGTGKADGGDENASEERENELSVADRDSFFGDGTPGNRSSASDASAKPSDGGADPHARHYQSDFAARTSSSRTDGGAVGGTVGGTVGGEKRKAVRGKMLKKLLKYDYRALFRFLLPCYIVLFSLSVLFAITLPIARWAAGRTAEPGGDEFLVSILVMAEGFCMLAVFAALFCCFAGIVSRFYKNLFSSEGYLTLSIPATPEEHLLSKLVSGVTATFLTVLAAFVAVLIVSIPYPDSELPFGLSVLKSILSSFGIYDAEDVLLLIELVVAAVVGVVTFYQVLFACICTGQIFANKNRVAAGIIVFVVFFWVTQFISTFLGASGVLASIRMLAGGHILVWTNILIDAGLSVGLFFWERYVLKNKINLQ